MRAVGGGDEHARQIVRTAAELWRITHADRETPAPLDGGGEVAFADGGLNHALHFTEVDAIARGSRAIGLDVEILCSGHLLGVNVACPGNCVNSAGNGPRALLQHFQVGAENLDADFRADTGGQHLDAVDDGLGPDIGHAGQGNGAVHFAL